MPMLLEDLAEETSASNRRAADRLDEEARELTKLEREVEELQQKAAASARELNEPGPVKAALEELRQRVVASARQATAYAIARLPQAEGDWQLALTVLRKKPTGPDAERLLRTFQDVFESGQRLVRSPRALWQIAQQVGAAPERLPELDLAEEKFAELAAEAKRRTLISSLPGSFHLISSEEYMVDKYREAALEDR